MRSTKYYVLREKCVFTGKIEIICETQIAWMKRCFSFYSLPFSFSQSKDSRCRCKRHNDKNERITYICKLLESKGECLCFFDSFILSEISVLQQSIFNYLKQIFVCKTVITDTSSPHCVSRFSTELTIIFISASDVHHRHDDHQKASYCGAVIFYCLSNFPYILPPWWLKTFLMLQLLPKQSQWITSLSTAV